jgi:DNA-binding GntR family transcriptional regulator
LDKIAVYNEIKNLIINQTYRPGQVLDEKDIMKEFNIGRTPLREVFLELQRDVLVKKIPRRGTFVTELDFKWIRNAFEIRITLEELVAEILIKRMTPKQTEELEKMLQKVTKLKNEDKEKNIYKAIEMEGEIHNYLYKTTDNDYLIEIMRRLQSKSIRYWHYQTCNDFVFKQLDDLNKLCEYIKAKDIYNAKACLRKHAEEFYEVMKDHLTT